MVGVLLGTAVAACGSTVPLSDQLAAGSGGGLGLEGSAHAATGTLGEPGSSSQSSTTTGTALSGGGSIATTTSAGGTAVVGPHGARTGPAASTPSGGVPVPTGGSVKVGITYFKDASAGLAAIGASGGTLGDQLSYAKIVVADANARGGLGGKRIDPVYFAYDANPGAASIPDQEAAACQAFTQDNQVSLVLGETIGADLISCLRKKGVPVVGENSSSGSGSARYAGGGVVDLGAFNVDRRALEQVAALQAQDYFSGWNTTSGSAAPTKAQLGIIVYNTPEWTASVDKHLAPALQSAGYGKPEIVVVSPHDSYDNLSAMSGQLQSAVLQFKARGVTHVIVWDDNGVATLFFMKAADSQGYRPRYGINSGNNMDLLVGTSLVPESQVLGAVGMGWIPMQDLPAADAAQTGPYGNPARRTCNALMAKGGQQGEKYNEYFALKYCGAMSAIKAGADRGGVGRAGFLSALDGLGSSVPSPITPATYIARGAYDGNGGIYHYVYDPKAKKMAYTSKVIALAH